MIQVADFITTLNHLSSYWCVWYGKSPSKDTRETSSCGCVGGISQDASAFAPPTILPVQMTKKILNELFKSNRKY